MIMLNTINNSFSELSYEDAISIDGGDAAKWDAVADLAIGVAVVSAAIPMGGAVTIACGCYYAGYQIGKLIK